MKADKEKERLRELLAFLIGYLYNNHQPPKEVLAWVSQEAKECGVNSIFTDFFPAKKA